jgi:ABC-2 type transport system ATP-binding protein
LTGKETITYFANLRGGMDHAYVDQLVQRLDLDPSRRFREYSRGNKQKVGLICALQHRPELLILDEPTAGLDPLVQQTFNEVLFETRADGRTVFLSSHIISEVERTCDRVGIIRDGRIVRLDTVEGVRALAAHEVELRFAEPVAAAPFAAIPGVMNLAEEGRTLRMLVTGPIAPVVRLAGQYELVDFVSREPSLEEVFLSEYAPTAAAR